MVDGTIVQEGQTKLLVPKDHSVGGPGKIGHSVFFNEQMAFSRDVSVMFLRTLSRGVNVADTMAATGSRAVRIANEIPEMDVVANDVSPYAMPYIEENVKINGLCNCTLSNKNMHSLLAEDIFDYVDVDPFGSPVPFLHSAIQGCKRYGYIAITATDTATLAGAQKLKCKRRYQVEPLGGPMCHEIGIRILLGTMAREMAKFNKGLKPILSFSADHYFRIYVQSLDGATYADKSLDSFVYLSYNPKTLERSFSRESDKNYKYGPFWGGGLFDRECISKMSSDNMSTWRRCDKMLEIWRDEIDEVPFLYEISEISSYLKLSTPPLGKFIEKMNTYGRTTKTHISPTAFKTVLSLKEIIDIYKECAEGC
ncbi:MAG: N2,N2-dimethylguanosine tRNA methyltransferase [archaeon]|nr:N2,N2-dimethylguanosine tRNA methyltransferase [archaeon]